MSIERCGLSEEQINTEEKNLAKRIKAQTEVYLGSSGNKEEGDKSERKYEKKEEEREAMEKVFNEASSFARFGAGKEITENI